MFRTLTIAAALALGACAQMKTDARPDPALAIRMQDDPAIASETQSLNRLTRIAIDANRLYDQAAEYADDADLQAALRSLSEQRKAFAQKLQNRVAVLGGKPAETGQATGAVHRSFLALRSLVQSDSVAAAEEVYRGETFIIEQLDRTLQGSLSPESRSMVQTEFDRVTTARQRVEQVKEEIEQKLASRVPETPEAQSPG
ncbi:MAG TPA: PA2169 family four-helix-bundle protein [Hyphomonadaceae bacterium]|nr:PA2169 family four-helix-bundle protein [Hyphomonadaceae bacterium]